MGNITSKNGGKGGITQAQKDKLDNLSIPLKSNISASSAPTVTDDTSKGYAVGSSWTYGGTTYTCNDATLGAAAWSIPTDIYYFADWYSLVAAINVSGSTYVGKFANVTNANSAPSVIASTYTAPASIPTPVADGNGGVYKVLAMGAGTYSVKLVSRPPAAFRVTSVMTVAAAKPTTDGYYIFSIAPSDGLPSGVALNDIAQRKSGVWSVYQTYASADVSVPVGSSATSVVPFIKLNGAWGDSSVDFGVSRQCAVVNRNPGGLSQEFYVGGYYFRMSANATSAYLQIARAPASTNNIYVTGVLTTEGGAITSMPMINVDSMLVYPTFYGVNNAGTMTTSYQKVEFTIMSRDSTARLWKVFMVNNGNASTVMAIDYYGIP